MELSDYRIEYVSDFKVIFTSRSQRSFIIISVHLCHFALEVFVLSFITEVSFSGKPLERGKMKTRLKKKIFFNSTCSICSMPCNPTL